MRYIGSEAIPMVVASQNPVAGKVLYGINEAGRGYGSAIDKGAESYEAFATGAGEGMIGIAMEAGFGNINGVSAAINPVKDKIADKALDAFKLIVKDDNVAKKLSDVAATALMSMTGTELEVNAEKYLRNIILGENNEISFTDPETLEEIAINLIIDEAFELADKGEIELKSGSDLENSWDKGYDEDIISEPDNNILQNISSLDDIFQTPQKLSQVDGSIMYKYLVENGYNVSPLSRGGTRGVSFENGGGFKVNWGGDRLLQYHPSKGSHHGGAYFKISSGEAGVVRIYLEEEGF